MKIYLLFPPHWTPSMPHLALPVLTGFLRKHGHDVVQRDLNVEVFDEILTRRHLRQSVERVRSRFGPGSAAASAKGGPGRPPADQVHWALQHGQTLADQVEAAKAGLRSSQFFEGERSEPAFMTLVQALELNSLAYFPARLEWTTFVDPESADRSRDLLKAARDPRINPFYEIFQHGILKDLQRDKPDLVGISIPTQAQLLAALTLAAQIRDAGLKCHITVGGPHVTMMREKLAKVPRMFDLIDSAVLFEGEIPLLHLLKALESGGDLSGVPNLMYRVTPARPGLTPPPSHKSIAAPAEVRTNPANPFLESRSAEEEQTPDFDGLPLERYLAPELVLPLATTHGCYYGKCAFCNVGYGSPNGYFPISVEHILGLVQTVQQKYHCRNIFFVDEAITPRIMRELSAALTAKDAQINWTVAARFEKSLTDELLTAAAESGCRMLLYGLESASEPVMKAMIKGTSKQEMARILHTATRLGIWNHTFFFFGFPGETLETAQETVNFVYENQEYIHSASPGAFLMEIYSPAYREPAKFGVREIIDNPERDLAIYFEYRLDTATTGQAALDEGAANELSERFVEQLPDKRYGQFYMSDVLRFLYSCQLHRQGLPLPRWIE